MNNIYTKIEHSTDAHNEWFVMQWCLGNTCTYSCSYCPPGLHNGSMKWPDVNKIKAFITRVKDHYYPKKLYFEFTGGEVTVYPEFLELCQFCKDMDVRIGLITNGSRSVRWWEENKHLFDHVCISFHPEEADPEHFIEVVNTLHDVVRTHVNIMMDPSKFDYCYDVAKRVKELGNISMALQTLIHDFGEVLYDYTEYQQDIIARQYELIVKDIKHTKSFEYYRGAMRVTYPDGSNERISPHSFISNKTNNWSGWDCYAGVEQLIVDMDGRIYPGWCKVGGPIGHINDTELNLPTKPILCTKTMCHCNFDIMSTKILNSGKRIIAISPV